MLKKSPGSKPWKPNQKSKPEKLQKSQKESPSHRKTLLFEEKARF